MFNGITLAFFPTLNSIRNIMGSNTILCSENPPINHVSSGAYSSGLIVIKSVSKFLCDFTFNICDFKA